MLVGRLPPERVEVTRIEECRSASRLDAGIVGLARLHFVSAIGSASSFWWSWAESSVDGPHSKAKGARVLYRYASLFI
jgi:hypothetical protein